MTLTGFLQKYIYIPLGGSRKGKVRTYLNVMVVFLISGFWHGANWTFVVWGMLHGVASVLNCIFKKQWDRLHGVFRWICTFIFINLTWLVFWADNIFQAKAMIGKVLGGEVGGVSEELDAKFSLIEIDVLNYTFSQNFLIYVFLLVAIFIILKLSPICMKKFRANIWNCFGTIILLVWSVLSLAGEADFIYFGF